MSDVSFDIWQDKAKDEPDFPDGVILAFAACRKCGMVEKCRAADFQTREEAIEFFSDKLAQECGEYEGNNYVEQKK